MSTVQLHPRTEPSVLDTNPVVSSRIRPMFAVGGLYSRSNGVAWIMRDLAAALGVAGAPVEVFAADCIGRGAASIGDIFEPPTRWDAGKGLWLGGLSWSPSTKRLIRNAVRRADVIHNHSLWMLPNHYASDAARRANKPVVITTHGALEPWALEHSGWKKRFVGKWFQWRDLHEAACLHVNSWQELEAVRRQGFKQPVAVIPNGVDLGKVDVPGAASVFLDRYPHLRGQKLLLFMARLHRKKGLQHLLEAWGDLARKFPDWHLVIAGPDCGMEPEVRSLVSANSLESQVTLTGPLSGTIKAGALQAAEVFVLPSFSEGFSMSVLEGLAAECPVLITPGCNFREAVQAGVAVEVAPDVAGTRDGLQRLLEMSDAERTAIGRAGRKFVREQYTWDAAASKTLELYRFLLNQSSCPEWVVEK